MVQRDIVVPYAGQMLGGFWAFGHPLFLVLLLTIVFNFMLGARFGGTAALPHDYTTYILAGLVPWQTFMSVLSRGCIEILGNANLVKQVVFPIEVLPIKGVLASLTTLVIGLVFLVGYTFVTTGGLPWTYALLPVLVVLQVLWMSGMAFLLSSLGVYFRDLKDMISVFVTASLYLLPIVYLPGAVPTVIRSVISLNPFSCMIWSYHDALYFGRFDHPWAWIAFVACSLGSFYGGFYLFQKLKPFFGNAL